MHGGVGRIESGAVRLDAPGAWRDGQRVLVIPLPNEGISTVAPPADLLEEDARELAPRRDAIGAANRDELE